MKLQFQANFIYKNVGLVFLYLSPVNNTSVLSTNVLDNYTCILQDQNGPVNLKHVHFKIKKVG